MELRADIGYIPEHKLEASCWSKYFFSFILFYVLLFYNLLKIQRVYNKRDGYVKLKQV
jgi:hypothetical protein